MTIWDNFILIEALQNTRYVVKEGARQKDEEWDPEENGGFAIHGALLTNHEQ